MKLDTHVLLDRALNRIGPLPVMSGTIQRLFALTADPNTSTDQLVATIEQDEAFAANLLVFANSAALARPVRARTIRQALMKVGQVQLGRIALEATTYAFLEQVPGNGRVSRGQLHMHAVAVAGCAATIAQRAGAGVETAHLAGLLHDVGKLVMPLAFGEEELDAIANQHPCGATRAALERELLGVDHAYAGALLAGRSDASEEVFAAIEAHHGGRSGQEAPTPEAACVQIANCVVGLLHGHPPDSEVLHVALQRLSLEAGILDELAQFVAAPTVAVEVDGSLADRVVQLERLANTDDLTGLNNRRHWRELVQARVHEGAWGSLLILDVDGLKGVNDTKGHAAGDLVIAEVARLISQHGIAGRLGGDEYGLWVEGDLQRGRDVADAVIRQMSSNQLGAGISVGLSCVPQHGRELTNLLRVADEALYAAKTAGRMRAVAGL